MSDWKYCPNCASRLEPGAKACAACGAGMPAATTMPNGEQPVPDDVEALVALQAELKQALAPQLHLVSVLGRGGMGVVFLARDPALKRLVVVKVLLPELALDPSARKRFEREAEAAASITHPNVVNVFQVGQLPQSGTSYFVMQHVAGETLEDAIPSGTRVPEARVRHIVGQIAGALASAHDRGLVHRDIKPSNVMLEGEEDRVVVLDFGISAVGTPEGRAQTTKLTQKGMSIGTPQYMSPEQAAGEDVSDRSDVYSLGLVAYELLAGRPPFDESNAMALIAAHINKTPPPLATVAPGLDPAVTDLVEQCLAKDPNDRPDAESLVKGLLPGSQQLIEWPPPGTEGLVGTGTFAFWVAMSCVIAATFLVTLEEAGGLVWTFGVTALVVTFLMFAYLELRFKRHFLPLWRSGYPVGVFLDVILDRWGDTQLLLNGVGPYATLSSDERLSTIRLRRWAALVVALGFVLSLVVAIRVSLGAEGSGGALRRGLTVAAAFFISLVVAHWLGRRDRRVRRRESKFSLARIFRRAKPVEVVVDDWLERANQSPSRARQARWFFRGTKYVAYPIVAFVVAVSVLGFIFVLIIPSVWIDRSGLDDFRVELSLHEASHALGDRLMAELVSPHSGEIDPTLFDAIPAVDTNVVHPSLDTIRMAMSDGAVDSSVTAALRHYVDQPQLAWWRTIVASDRLPPFWYLPDSGETPPDSLGRVTGRARHALRDGARFLAAHAAVAYRDGDEATALARARDIIWLARMVSHEPDASFEFDVANIFLIGAPILDSLGTHSGDTILVRQAHELRAAADARISSRLRLRFAWDARLADLNEVDSAAIASWKATVGDPTELPSHRWLAYGAMANGHCFNRWELFRGANEIRRRYLAEADSLLRDVPRFEVWEAYAALSVSEWYMGIRRFSFCLGSRAGSRNTVN